MNSEKLRIYHYSLFTIHYSPFTIHYFRLLPFLMKNYIITFCLREVFMKLVADLRTLLIALWLGAALFFSFAVAQSAFAVLPSRELAGNVVSRTLAVVNYSGFIIGLVLLITSFISRQAVSRAKLLIEQILLLLITIACGVGQFVIGARLHGLRRQIGRPIDEIAVDNPLRADFNNLHVYSVIILMTAMIAAAIAFFLIARRAGNSSEYK